MPKRSPPKNKTKQDDADCWLDVDSESLTTKPIDLNADRPGVTQFLKEAERIAMPELPAWPTLDVHNWDFAPEYKLAPDDTDDDLPASKATGGNAGSCPPTDDAAVDSHEEDNKNNIEQQQTRLGGSSYAAILARAMANEKPALPAPVKFDAATWPALPKPHQVVRQQCVPKRERNNLPKWGDLAFLSSY